MVALLIVGGADVIREVDGNFHIRLTGLPFLNDKIEVGIPLALFRRFLVGRDGMGRFEFHTRPGGFVWRFFAGHFFAWGGRAAG
jgi:hypothetical protein